QWLLDHQPARRGMAHHPILQVRDVLAALFYVANWGRALGWADLGIVGQTWTLSIEEQFYLLWPVILLLLLRSRGLVWSVVRLPFALAIVSYLDRAGLLFAHAGVARLIWSSDTHAEGILLGCALALAIGWYWPLAPRV